MCNEKTPIIGLLSSLVNAKLIPFGLSEKGLKTAMDIMLPILIMGALVGGIATLFIVASALLGPKKRTPVKDEPFECGIASDGISHRSVPVRFYLMALLFILFDVEMAFLFPWAVVFRELGMFGFIEMLIFIAVGGVGFIYAWKIGAMEWE